MKFSQTKFYIYLFITHLGVSSRTLNYQENWESCIDETSKYLGHAIGAMYVSHYFPQESQNEVIFYSLLSFDSVFLKCTNISIILWIVQKTLLQCYKIKHKSSLSNIER